MFTVEEVNELADYLEFEQEKDNSLPFSDRDTELLLEALALYKEINF